MGKQEHAPRRQYNNQNPNNKLSLNKFHQLSAPQRSTESKLLHKKKRDLERMIKFRQGKNQEVDVEKVRELQALTGKLEGRKKGYEKNMRKEFFIKNKYKQIMEIEMRKVNKKLRALEQEPVDQNTKKQISEWQKKQRYIKFYPKNLKYVSLFPSTKPLQPAAIEFQQKIMNDIEQTHARKVQQRNQYKSQNAKVEKEGKRVRKDNFFIQEEEQEPEKVQEEEQDGQEEGEEEEEL